SDLDVSDSVHGERIPEGGAVANAQSPRPPHPRPSRDRQRLSRSCDLSAVARGAGAAALRGAARRALSSTRGTAAAAPRSPAMKLCTLLLVALALSGCGVVAAPCRVGSAGLKIVPLVGHVAAAPTDACADVIDPDSVSGS